MAECNVFVPHTLRRVSVRSNGHNCLQVEEGVIAEVKKDNLPVIDNVLRIYGIVAINLSDPPTSA